MWDFTFLANLALMARTWPYIMLRALISSIMALGLLALAAAGAVVGYGLGAAFGDVDAQLIGGGLGGLVAFGFGASLLFLVRAYMLYLVTAGQIAVMVELMDGRTLPAGIGQLQYGAQAVRARFLQASALFALNEMIHAVTRTFRAMVSLLPLPGLDGLSGLLNSFLKVSVGLVDEIILAYALRTRSEDPWEAARHALVLYAQNAGPMMRNAAFLAAFIHVATVLGFLLCLLLSILAMPLLPGLTWVAVSILALAGAWVLRVALIRPLAVACLWQAFKHVTDGQTPDPDWERKLAGLTDRFSRPAFDAVAPGN